MWVNAFIVIQVHHIHKSNQIRFYSFLNIKKNFVSVVNVTEITAILIHVIH